MLDYMKCKNELQSHSYKKKNSLMHNNNKKQRNKGRQQ